VLVVSFSVGDALELLIDVAVNTCVSMEIGGVNILASLSFIEAGKTLLSLVLLAVKTLVSSN
jgi:DUF917 family protein